MDETEVLDSETSEETTSDDAIEESGQESAQEKPVETEQTEVEVEVGGEKIKLDRDKFNEVVTATQNAQSWEKKYHEKGRKLNQFSQELQTKEKELANDKQVLDEWKAVKEKLDANPESRKFIADTLNQAKPSVDPVIQAVQKENADLRKDIERDRAVQKLSAKYDDFDNDALAQFQGDFNLNNMEDAMEFTYRAWKGASIDDEIQKAKVDMVKGMVKKKGAPPTGKKAATPPPEPKTWAEMIQAGKDRVDREGTILKTQ